MLIHGREVRLPFNLDLPVHSLVLVADGNLSDDDSRTHPVPAAQQLYSRMSALIAVTRDALHTSVNRMKCRLTKAGEILNPGGAGSRCC